jgi:hypothetical protein
MNAFRKKRWLVRIGIALLLVAVTFFVYRFLSARPHIERSTWQDLWVGMTEKEIEEMIGFRGSESTLVVKGGSVMSIPGAEVNPHERIWLGDDCGIVVAFDKNNRARRIIVFIPPKESLFGWVRELFSPERKLLMISRWQQVAEK